MNRIYLRVSTTTQDFNSQLPELQQWAHGKQAVWYQEKASGKTMDRPQFDKLLKEARAGDTLVIVRLDRLGRTASGLTTLFDLLRSRRINLVSLRDGIDLSTPSGSLVANVLASVAAFETEVRAERIKAGLDAKRQAVAEGRDTWDKGGRPSGTATKVTATIRQSILSQHKTGTPIAQIAREHCLSRPTVYAVLHGERK